MDCRDAKMKRFINNQIERQKETFDPTQIRHFVDLYLLKEQEGHEEGDVFSSMSVNDMI